MNEFTKILKEKREELNLSLSEVSKEIKVSVHFLELIESGDFHKLPSYVHAYGFSKAYAEFLGFSFEEIKPLFDEVCKKEDFDKKYIKIESDEIIQKEVNLKNIHKFFIVFIIFVIAIIILVFYFLNKNKEKVLKEMSVDNTASTSVMKILDNSQSDNVSKIVEEKIKSVNPKEIVEKISEKKVVDNVTFHKITLEFDDICWVNIKIDNETVLDFIANPGTKKEIKFKKFFLIDIGNAAALKIKYDNQTFSRFGGFRQPVKNLYFTINEDNYLMYEKIN
ncbi:DUF4115 domain-containing protein [Deferribacter thermophilus]|uniref:helix-turn-helix domain-containing protein n=1 Tax=Deferribacter thermophilus TaxID=53573 RepID=UPI003C25072C